MIDSSNQSPSSDDLELSVGQILKAARESSGLSVDDVAGRLKLTVRQLSSIESDDFESLPGNTFARGFVRNYARLLGLDAQPLLDRLASSLPKERIQAAMPYVGDATALNSVPVGSRKSQSWPRLVAAILGLIIGVGVVFWYLQRPPEPDMSLTTMPMPVVDDASAVEQANPASDVNSIVPGVESLPMEQPASAAGEAMDFNSSKAASTPEATLSISSTPAVEATPAGAERIRVLAKFDSWVQIVDAQGRVLISQLMRQGMEQSVIGQAPFKVKIGNSPQTQLFYRDQRVDLAPYTRADVATLELK